jgi:hypothetical protein
LPDEREILKQQKKVKELSKSIEKVSVHENNNTNKLKDKNTQNEKKLNNHKYINESSSSNKEILHSKSKNSLNINKPHKVPVKNTYKQKSTKSSSNELIVPAIVTGLVIGSALIVFMLIN